METFNRKINFEAVANFAPITRPVQQHLLRVYVALSATILMAAIGSIVHLLYNVGGILTLLGTLGLIVLLACTPQNSQNESTRLGYLLGIGFLKGCSIGPLLSLALDVDPSIIATALFGTVAVFGCFSVCAIMSERRSMFYLSGFLSSALSLLCLIGFMNIFLWSSALYTVQIYLGLLVFCGFVMFDTQLIVEKALLGSRDYVLHALELFLDFINIFVRLVIILTRNKKNSKK